jgi:hypothetical protein
MARTAVTLGFTAVGTAAGAYFGNPMLGAQLGMMAGSIAGALLFPGGEDQKGPRLGDLRVGDASYGLPIPIVYGAARISGVMIWTGGIEERATEQSLKGGGPTSTTYAYYCSFAVGLCEGPLATVRKIWMDTKLVYDVSQDNLGIISQRIGEEDPRDLLNDEEAAERRKAIMTELTAVQTALTIYLGTEEQLPDPVIEAHEGAGQVPAHRGTAYLVLQDLPLVHYGNRIPSISAEVTTQAAPAYPRRTVLPTNTLHVDEMVFDASRQRFYNHHAGNLTIVDGLAMELVRSGPVDTSIAGGLGLDSGLTFGLAVDRDGYLYAPLKSDTNTNRLGRVDPVAMAVTHVNLNVFTALPENLGACACIDVSNTFVWYTSFIGGSLAYCFLRPGAISPHNGLPVTTMTAVAGVPYAVLPTGGIGKCIALTPDETAWIVCSALYNPLGTEPTYLVHFEPTGAYALVDLTADLTGGAWVAYDEQTQALLVAGNPPGNPYAYAIARYDLTLERVTSVSPPFNAPGYLGSAFRRGVVGRRLWLPGQINHVLGFDVDTLTVVEDIDLLDGYPIGGTAYSGFYDPATHAFWQTESGGIFAKYFFDRTEPQPLDLGAIVVDLSQRAGLDPADVDAASLTDPVHGFVVSQRAEARASLETVLSAFLADGVESDWRLRFMHRASAPVATLTVDDLAAHEPGQALPDRFTPTRLDDQALPIRVDVTYPDPARDYQDTVQHARRMQAGQRSRSQREVRTPVILTADQARALAEQILSEAWTMRTTYQLPVTYRWTTLDPGDILNVDVNNRRTVMRLTQIANGANGILEIQASAYARNIYTASMSVGVIPETSPAVIAPSNAPTGLFLIDTHLLRDVDEGSGYYMAMTPQGSGGWSGAVALSSPDGNAWREEDTLVTPVAWGSALHAMAVGSPYVIDYGHTLDVRMVRGVPTSISVEELLNGQNAAILGNEILQWQTATALDANTWRLSNLLRGRRGTEWAIPGHQIGERFLVLHTATIRRENMGLSEVGTTRLYRAVTINTDVLAATSQAFVNTALGLKPYSPDHVHGTRNASNDLTVTWTRRTRLGGLWIDGRDVLLGETSEAYEVDIVSGGTVVRTLTSATQTVLYTAAQQTTDGLTPGAMVTVTVYQMGQLGRGWGTTATL